MRLGVVILPEARGADAAAPWRRAEDIGLATAWTYDHIAWRSLRDSTWFAAVPTLAVAATATSTIRLGTLVASPNFRHPVPFARELVTLDDLSGGRLTVGLGAGGMGWDATVLGQEAWSAGERAARFAEFVELLDLLLRRPRTTFRGRWYSADEAPMSPGCVQQPRAPFAIAATGPKGMALAARFAQVWVTNGDRNHTGPLLRGAEAAAVVKRQAAELDRACEAVGRDPKTIDRLVLGGLRLDEGLGSAEEFRDLAGRYEEIGMTDVVVHWPRPEDPFQCDEDHFESVVTSARP